MNYSNWRKILIILMIINLLWIFFNRVFATNVNSELTYNVITYNQDIDIPETLDDEYFIICIGNRVTGFNGLLYTVVYLDEPINAHYDNSHNLICDTANVKFRHFQTSGPSQSLSYIQNKINTDDYTFSDNIKTVVGTNFIPNTYGYNYSIPVATNFDIRDTNGDIVINKTHSTFSPPKFDNPTSEIQTLDFDYLFINPMDYGIENTLYFKVLEVTNVVEDENNAHNNVYYYNDLTFSLDSSSKYKKELFDTGTYYYSMPFKALKIKKDTSYYFVLTNSGDNINNTIGEITRSDNIYDVILCDSADVVTTNEEILNSLTNNDPSDNTNDTINNNLPRPSYDDNNINIPGMNVDIPDDPTTSSFNWIFNFFNNLINSYGNNDVEDINIEFTPFGWNDSSGSRVFSFSISPYLVRNFLGENNPILLLIESFYWFAVSYYILQNIRKYAEKIKTGDIMTHTDSNIKADML